MTLRMALGQIAVCSVLTFLGLGTAPGAANGLISADLYKLRSVGEVEISPDGRHVAYAVRSSDKPGRPYPKTWVIELSSGRSKELGGSGARWSPDGQWLAYIQSRNDGQLLTVARPDGSDVRLSTPVSSTNHPLPGAGESIAWSPDGRRVAFISSVPGPEGDPNADPIVITRYLYKPTASEGNTRFNDNRRTHIFVADLTTKAATQLTRGDYYEHSIAWSPDGREILFISNRGPDPDRFFNNDIFAVKIADGAVRQLTDTRNAEYAPAWSPDGRMLAYLGTKRELTSSETTMEDTHVWLMNADGSNRRDIGAQIDNRQAAPQWSPDGRFVYFTVQERGNHSLYRVSTAAGKPERILGPPGSVGSWSVGRKELLAYGLDTPSAPADLFMKAGSAAPRRLTELNKEWLASRTLAEVEAVDFKSFDGTPIQAFLTRPLQVTAGSRAPMIVIIHGGPHGQNGPNFDGKAQIYANHGFASLMVNYRGSTGYGQKLADAIFGDQNGAEAKDVIAGVDAVLAKHAWIDPERLGIEGVSYGGQLTDWIITQTPRFKAAIPIAGISNLVSFNYMAYYHDYLAVEFGSYPHQNRLMDKLWERSPLRYADRVKTPVMFVHGENDNDVPIAEAEQYFIALKDVGVDTVMIRYPREGHGIRETRHAADLIERSMAWYDRHFSAR